jgi:hypothetical protein
MKISQLLSEPERKPTSINTMIPTPTCLNSLSVKRSLLLGCIAATILTSGVSSASDVGLGAGIGGIDARGVDPSTYGLQESIVCPVITVGAGVFAGNGNQWGNQDFMPYNSANAGGSNVGGIAGITMPLGGSLARYCRKQAEMQITRTRLSLLSDERVAAVNFLIQCDWLQTYYPKYKEELDKQAGDPSRASLAFNLFKECPDPLLRVSGRIGSRESDASPGKNTLGSTSKERQPVEPPSVIKPPLTTPLSPSNNPTPVTLPPLNR